VSQKDPKKGGNFRSRRKTQVIKKTARPKVEERETYLKTPYRGKTLCGKTSPSEREKEQTNPC